MSIETFGYVVLLVGSIWLAGAKIKWDEVGVVVWYTAVAVLVSAGAYFTMGHHTRHRRHE